MDEDFDVEWILNRTRHIASGMCEIEEFHDGPNVGCAEFDSGKSHLCQSKAITLMVIEDAAEPDPDCYQLCDSHAQRMREDAVSYKFGSRCTILREETI